VKFKEPQTRIVQFGVYTLTFIRCFDRTAFVLFCVSEFFSSFSSTETASTWLWAWFLVRSSFSSISLLTAAQLLITLVALEVRADFGFQFRGTLGLHDARRAAAWQLQLSEQMALLQSVFPRRNWIHSGAH
jgi:hypothetical protein